MTRHQMRESIFLLTFERIFNEEPVETIIETAKECETVAVDNRVIAWFEDICQKQEIIDEEIKKYLKNWTIARISKVSLAALRVAMYEILFVEARLMQLVPSRDDLPDFVRIVILHQLPFADAHA